MKKKTVKSARKPHKRMQGGGMATMEDSMGGAMAQPTGSVPAGLRRFGAGRGGAMPQTMESTPAGLRGIVGGRGMKAQSMGGVPTGLRGVLGGPATMEAAMPRGGAMSGAIGGMQGQLASSVGRGAVARPIRNIGSKARPMPRGGAATMEAGIASAPRGSSAISNQTANLPSQISAPSITGAYAVPGGAAGGMGGLPGSFGGDVGVPVAMKKGGKVQGKKMRGGGLARKGVGMALAKGGLAKRAGGCAKRGVGRGKIV